MDDRWAWQPTGFGLVAHLDTFLGATIAMHEADCDRDRTIRSDLFCAGAAPIEARFGARRRDRPDPRCRHPRADEPGSGRVSSARLRHQPAKTGVSALMSSDALCARTIELPRWPIASPASAARADEHSPTPMLLLPAQIQLQSTPAQRLPRSRQRAGNTAIASTSRSAPSRASFGTSSVVLAGGAATLTNLSRTSR
jgi:hypothetical protein